MVQLNKNYHIMTLSDLRSFASLISLEEVIKLLELGRSSDIAMTQKYSNGNIW